MKLLFIPLTTVDHLITRIYHNLLNNFLIGCASVRVQYRRQIAICIKHVQITYRIGAYKTIRKRKRESSHQVFQCFAKQYEIDQLR